MIRFVRHGETAVNRDGRLLGHADVALNDTGRQQAARLAAALAAWAAREGPAPLVLTSPLQRARDTATAIGVALGVPTVVEARLVELDYGEWDQALLSSLPAEEVARFHSDPDFAPPGGESLRALRARVAPLVAELVDHDGPVIAVSHVSPIKAGVLCVLGVDDDLVAWRMRLDTASVTTVGHGPQGPVLLGFNERLV